MEPLVHYAAVAKNNTILADYQDEKSEDFVHIAAKCLDFIPPLHSRFSYTTSNRMFICLIEGLFIYCAIMDEALSKAKAFMFLEHVRDAFKVLLLQQRDVYVDTLTPHSFHLEMDPFFKHLALPLVGMPQREKIRLTEEEFLCQAHKDAENDYDVSSPSAVAPLKEMNDEDLYLHTESKPTSASSRSPRMPLIGKIKRGKKKTRDYEKGVISSPIDSSCEALNKGRGLEIMIEDNSPCEHAQTHRSGWQGAQDSWWRHVKLVIILDLLVCLVLLAIWLSVCKGVKCLEKR